MAILITSLVPPPADGFDERVCTSSYDEFEQSRVYLPFDGPEQAQFAADKNKFKDKVVNPLFQDGRNVIASFFTFSVEELKQLMAETPDADYIHFHNTLNTEKVNYLYAVPVNSSLPPGEREIIKPTTVCAAAFPCPPDPRCPIFAFV